MEPMLNNMTHKMQIEIWSDIVCPFCSIGKKRLEKALLESGTSDNVNIIWKSFQLNSLQKTEPGKSINQYLSEHKRISLNEAESMNLYVTEMAYKEGLRFDFSKTVVANSFKAHQLLQLAKIYNLQNTVGDALFQAYFSDGKNIDDTSTLQQIGVAAGIKSEDLENFTDNKSLADAVLNDIEEARQLQISGVPFFVFNQKYAISGSREVNYFIQALQVSLSEWQSQEVS